MTQRLVGFASQNWPRFDGWAASRNIDPLGLPIDRMLSMVYFWATQFADEKETRKFDARLWIPPKDEEIPAQSPWSAENERSAFSAFSREISGGAESSAVRTQ